MILVISSAAKARDSLALLQEATGERAQLAVNLRLGTRELREEQYSAVVIDEILLDADPQQADVVLDAAGCAIPVVLNFAISGPERFVRDVRAALRRHQRECAVAQRAVENSLRSELNEALTGILLSSQLALSVPALPPPAEAKMRSVYQLAMNMRSRLEHES